MKARDVSRELRVRLPLWPRADSRCISFFGRQMLQRLAALAVGLLREGTKIFGGALFPGSQV